DLHFFDAFAALGSYGQIQGWRSESGLRELGCGEVSNFAYQCGYCASVHLCAIGPPIVAAASQERTPGTVVNFDFIGVRETEVEEFLVLEIVKVLVQSSASRARYLVDTRNGAGLRIVVVLVFPDL